MKTKTAVFLIVFGFLAGWGCSGQAPDKEEKPPKPQAQTVRTARVAGETLEERIEAVGSLKAGETVEVSSEIPGRVVQVHFEGGREVEKGRLLFTLESEKLERQAHAAQAALASARSRLQTAKRQYDRIKQLWVRDAVPTQRFDQAQGEYETARAEVRRLHAQLAAALERLKETEVKAPLPGMISQNHVDPGDVVKAGQTLASLYDHNALEVAFTAPQRYMARLEPGQRVELKVSSHPDRSFSGRVSYVSPSVDPSTRDVRVKADVDNADKKLKPGAFTRVWVTLEVRKNRPVIPEAALIGGQKGYTVFTVENGVARRRRVQTGLRRAGRVEVTDGLMIGETVVVGGQMDLTDGDEVQAAPGEKQSQSNQQAGDSEAESP